MPRTARHDSREEPQFSGGGRQECEGGRRLCVTPTAEASAFGDGPFDLWRRRRCALFFLESYVSRFRPQWPRPTARSGLIIWVMKRVVPQNPPGTRGLARHPALVDLSRDHHFALRQALWLRRAADAATADAAIRSARDYLDFYRGALLAHLADEEEVLLPLAGHADPAGAERIRAEHRELHALTEALDEALEARADPRSLGREIGELLDDHVRFEERAFFMAVQNGLSEAGLEDLQKALRVRRNRRSARAPGIG